MAKKKAKVKGTLSQTEKYAIQGMIQDGKEVSEIEDTLGRTGTAVKNYITSELPNLIDNIIEARLQRVDAGAKAEDVFPEEFEREFTDEDYYDVEDEEVARSDSGNKIVSSKDLIKKKLEQENAPIHVDEEIEKETIHKLRGVGLDQEEAEDLLRRAKRKLVRTPDNAGQLLSFCLKQLNAGDHTGSKTAGGKAGVAVWNGTASAIADNGRSNRALDQSQINRSTRGRGNSIYNPKTGETS